MFTAENATNFQIPWDAMDAILQGKSPIDLKGLPVRSREEAAELVASYGYDLNNPEDKAEIEMLYAEAIEFVENKLLSPDMDWPSMGEPEAPSDIVPNHIIASRDVTDLILTASQADGPDKYWACAILKVLHTLVFVHNGFIYRYFEEASESILSKFNTILIPQADDTFLLKGSEGRYLKLFGFEAKYQKPRESILVKLLCKKENVAEDVWDLIGVRIITFHPAETIQAINMLREQKVIVLSNAMSSRTRNTLIDYDAVKTDYEQTYNEYMDGLQDENAIRKFFEQWSKHTGNTETATEANKGFEENPSSSPDYKAIHITCRHLLKLKAAEDQQDPGKQYYRFAFPYEIQLMDKAGYLESKSGKSAHTLYKQKQLAAARRRVLGLLLTAKEQV